VPLVPVNKSRPKSREHLDAKREGVDPVTVQVNRSCMGIFSRLTDTHHRRHGAPASAAGHVLSVSRIQCRTIPLTVSVLVTSTVNHARGHTPLKNQSSQTVQVRVRISEAIDDVSTSRVEPLGKVKLSQ
jgi:hypothetical protein